MKGIIKTLPIQNPKAGSKVLWGRDTYTIISIKKGKTALIKNDFNNSQFDKELSLLTEMFVEYGKGKNKKVIPLKKQYWQDILNQFNFYVLEATHTTYVDNFEVEFETELVYVEPDDSIHCNRGADVEYAKIIESNEMKWKRIIKEYESYSSEEYINHREDESMYFWEWLIKYYKSPEKLKEI